MADQRLRGKVVIVAGGATGIGAATALKLSEAGAAVVIPGFASIDTPFSTGALAS